MPTNPVFNKFNRELRSGQYAGFDSGRQGGGAPAQQFGAPQYGQPQQNGPQYAQPQYGQPPYAQTGYGAPAQADRMTLDDVATKSLNLFGLLIVVGAVSFYVAHRSIETGTNSTALGLWAGGGIVALVLSFMIALRRTISVPLILAYTVFEGMFIGAVSAYFNSAYPGVVAQAVLATLCVFGGMLVGYRTGLIKVTARSRRIFTGMLIGYMLFSLVNFALVLFHVSSGFGIGGSGPLGIGISLFAVALASCSLAVDFDDIAGGVRAGVPSNMSWLMAYGLMVSVVWLYIEMLRLISRLRD